VANPNRSPLVPSGARYRVVLSSRSVAYDGGRSLIAPSPERQAPPQCTGHCPAPRTWLDLTTAPLWLGPNPRAPLESVEAIAMITWPCRRRRRWVHHRTPPLSHHACWKDSSGEPLSQPRAPVNAGCRVGHDGEDATVDELAIGELRPVSAVLCSCVADGWDLLTCGPPTVSRSGCTGPGAPSS